MTGPDRVARYRRVMHKSPVIHTLAPRERQVVQHVAEGYTNREVALLLGISAHAVRNTLAIVFIKTGVSSRVVLARLYLTGTMDGAAQ